jgi:hypothetical protein
MQQAAPRAWGAFVGRDWADRPHAACLPAAGATHRESCRLTHTPAALEAWGSAVPTRLPGPPLARGRARNTGPLGAAVRQDDCRMPFPSNPRTLARYRAAFPPRRATVDPTVVVKEKRTLS